MKPEHILIVLLLCAQTLFGQVATLAPVSDLSKLGIRNLVFSAPVKDTEAFVIEIDTTSELRPEYLRRIYIRPAPGVALASLEVPILETQQFFAPHENNRVIIRMPYGTVHHESAGLEGRFGGSDFSFTVKEWKKDIGREIATTYRFKLAVSQVSDLPEAAKNVQAGSTFITAEKK